VLSFLGFDAISTLAEEATGGGKTVGGATMISLGLAAVPFIVQT
jgi:amino acid transporter